MMHKLYTNSIGFYMLYTHASHAGVAAALCLLWQGLK